MSCRVLKNGDAQITQNYEAHLIKCASGNGWAKGTDIVKKKSQCDWIVAHTEGRVIKVTDYLDGTNFKIDKDGMGYGNYVMILHNNNYVTLYAHLEKVKVQEGQAVKAGDTLGFMGNTGSSYGAHLHFEVRHYNCTPTKTNLHNVNSYAWFNPEPYINADLPEQNNASSSEAVGFLDSAKYSKRTLTVSGWAYHNGGSKKVTIKLYNGKSLVKSFTVNANLRRPDVKQAMGYSTDNVGFSSTVSINIPNATYKVKAYVDDTELTNMWVIEVKEQVLTDKSYPDYTLNSDNYYRVRKAYKDEKSSLGSWHVWKSAYETWNAYKDKSYHIYDARGNQLD